MNREATEATEATKIKETTNNIRKAEVQDASRIAEILIFAKRMHYREIFHNDKVSFGEMQVLPLAQEYIDDSKKLDSIWVYDDEFVKGMIHIEQDWVQELYIEPFFQSQGIGKKLMNYAIEEFEVKYLFVLEKNERAIGFYRSCGFRQTKERKLQPGTKEYLMKMERVSNAK